MGIPGSLTLYIFITYQPLTAAISCLCIWPDLTKTPNVISKTILSVHFIAKTVLCGYRSQMRVKVLVAQSCLTIGDSVGCSPPGSSVHGILPARILEWGILCQGIFPTQGLNPGLLFLPHMPPSVFILLQTSVISSFTERSQ